MNQLNEETVIKLMQEQNRNIQSIKRIQIFYLVLTIIAIAFAIFSVVFGVVEAMLNA